MEYDLINQLIAKAVGIHTFRLPSVGLFSSPLIVESLFGIPRSGFYQSRSMDIKYTRMSVAGPTLDEVISFTKQSGIYSSYLESSIFEQLFRRTQGSGISAVQLLLDASAQQIPIYSLDSQNADQILPRLTVSEKVKTEIRHALNAGQIAIIPERELAKGSWSGIGYIIQNQKTGGGAYMIDGGLNGGGLVEECGEQVTVPVVQAVQAIVMTAMILAMLAALIYGLPALVGAGAAVGGKVLVTLQALMVSMGMTFLAFPAYATIPVGLESCEYIPEPFQCKGELEIKKAAQVYYDQPIKIGPLKHSDKGQCRETEYRNKHGNVMSLAKRHLGSVVNCNCCRQIDGGSMVEEWWALIDNNEGGRTVPGWELLSTGQCTGNY